jgi:ribosome-binding factor A
LGGGRADDVAAGLNRVTRFLRGRLGNAIGLRFTPDLKFIQDQSFDAAERMTRLLSHPRVRRDVEGED